MEGTLNGERLRVSKMCQHMNVAPNLTGLLNAPQFRIQCSFFLSYPHSSSLVFFSHSLSTPKTDFAPFSHLTIITRIKWFKFHIVP